VKDKKKNERGRNKEQASKEMKNVLERKQKPTISTVSNFFSLFFFFSCFDFLGLFGSSTVAQQRSQHDFGQRLLQTSQSEENLGEKKKKKKLKAKKQAETKTGF
jgi:hypothetical protein